jgi:crotonobetainyl-CoA:carnitine CoA-transferase CaiB-like acyl-CoA transferase
MNKDPYNLLSGVKIIELTTYVAAPSAGRILADWGADIIKVESVPRGDTTRFAAPLPGMKKITYDFKKRGGFRPGRRKVINTH